MASSSSHHATPHAFPRVAWALLALALLALYVLVHENGVLLTADGAALLHELTHDARHGLGVPCH